MKKKIERPDKIKAASAYFDTALKRSGKSGNAVAKKIGVSPSTINRAKKAGKTIDGKVTTAPKLETLRAVQRETGVPFTPEVIEAYDLRDDLVPRDRATSAPTIVIDDLVEVPIWISPEGQVLLRLVGANPPVHEVVLSKAGAMLLRDALAKLKD